MNFYVSIFKNSKVVKLTRYGEAGPGTKETVISETFQLEGQTFYALNGGPLFSFTPAISLFVNCETQQEVDELWEKPSAAGKKRKMRLAERQVWAVVANHSDCFARDAGRQRSAESRKGHAGDDADGED